MLRKAFTTGASLALTSILIAQCPAGESALTVTVDTDGWGYEVYWEIVDTGAGCGVNPWAFGGNSEDVGCDGEGNANGSATYASNAVITEGPFCLPTTGSYDFIHVDSYGDGGTVFELAADGIAIGAYTGTGDGNTWPFSPAESSFVDNDSPCDAALIALDGDTVTVSTQGASVQIGEPSPDANPMGGCTTQGWWCASDGNIARTVWLHFTASSSDPVLISTCHEGTNMDTQLALYRVDDCADWSTFTLVGASDDIPGGCGTGNGYASSLFSDCLEAGATYFIQLDGWAGSSGTALVSLVSNPDATPALNVMTSDMDCPLNEETEPSGQILLALYESGLASSYHITGNGVDADAPYVGALFPGTYEVELTTACGVTFSETVSLSAPDPFVFDFGSTETSCEGASDGSIEVTLTGGTAPYEFAWSSSAGFSSNDEDPSGLAEGLYDLEVTDDAGCAFLASVEVTSGSSLAFSLGPDTLICLDETLLLYGPPALDYVWQDGSINQFLYIEASEWGVGTYPLYLVVSNDEGCEHSDVMILTIGSCTTGTENGELEGLKLFPNPAVDRLNWSLPSGEATGRVRDAAGRVVAEFSGTGGELNVADWPAGLYVFEVAEGQEVQRFQVVR
jgi:hypothetical protein